MAIPIWTGNTAFALLPEWLAESRNKPGSSDQVHRGKRGRKSARLPTQRSWPKPVADKGPPAHCRSKYSQRVRVGRTSGGMFHDSIRCDFFYNNHLGHLCGSLHRCQLYGQQKRHSGEMSRALGKLLTHSLSSLGIHLLNASCVSMSTG